VRRNNVQDTKQRTSVRCQYVRICGGCSLQHIKASVQLEYKQKILFDNLRGLGNVDCINQIEPIQSDSWHYRRKARPGIRYVPRKKGGIGFRERRNSYITSLQECYTLDR